MSMKLLCENDPTFMRVLTRAIQKIGVMGAERIADQLELMSIRYIGFLV